MEEEDSSFFGYNKHDSLPALQIDQEKHIENYSALLTSTLDIDEDQFHFFPPPDEGTVETANHVRRPSSPRPNSNRFSNPNPHVRRVSGQLNKAPPPPSPSALVTAALQQQQQQAALFHQPHPSGASSISASSISPDKSTSRYSFGALMGSIGGWSPSSSSSLPAHPLPPVRGTSQLSMSTSSRPPAVAEVEEPVEEDSDGEGLEEDVFITTHSLPPAPGPGPAAPPNATHGTPVQLQHQNQHQNRLRYIAKNEVPRPKAGRLSLLNFTRSVCCLDEPVFVV